jgi:hypothetical protein
MLIGVDKEYSCCNEIIFIASLCTLFVTEVLKGHMFSSLSGSFRISAITKEPKANDMITGNKNTKYATLAATLISNIWCSFISI